jgi:hypothetical protein
MNLGSSMVSRWRAVGGSLLVGLLFAIGMLVFLPTAETEANGAPNAGHVVVQFADGATAVRPVTWTGTISRVVALELAGFKVESGGDSVCSIEGEGCPATNCFCLDNLWAQGQWDGRAWDASAWPPPLLADGDVVAFRMSTQPDYSDWGLTGFMPGAAAYVAASDAVEWMRGQQRADGGYSDGFDPIGTSVRALIALGATGHDPDEWGSPSLLYHMTNISRTETAEYVAKSAAKAGKLAVGVAWTGQTITDFAGINLPISITAYYSPTTGGYGAGSGDTVWAMLGLSAMGEPIPDTAVGNLYGLQNADGGWAWNEWDSDSEVQHTATCVQALLAAGESVTSTEVVKALSFIAASQNSDGGYPYQPAGASDLGTTAHVAQTLLSAGKGEAGNWCSEIGCAYLLNAQQADGSFPAYSALYATQEAIPALMHRPFGPLAAWSYNCYAIHLPHLRSP